LAWSAIGVTRSGMVWRDAVPPSGPIRRSLQLATMYQKGRFAMEPIVCGVVSRPSKKISVVAQRRGIGFISTCFQMMLVSAGDLDRSEDLSLLDILWKVFH
jgi:hypothetical protein